jgi:hypothetical protein
MLTDERACSPGVVEVDVGEEEMSDLSQLVPSLGEACPQGGKSCRRTGVKEGETVVGLHQVDADTASVALVQEVDRCPPGVGHAGP